MRKIVAYRIVRGGYQETSDWSSIEDNVMDAMEQGWEPFGSPTVMGGGFGSNDWLYQAMVKYEE